MHDRARPATATFVMNHSVSCQSRMHIPSIHWNSSPKTQPSQYLILTCTSLHQSYHNVYLYVWVLYCVSVVCCLFSQCVYIVCVLWIGAVKVRAEGKGELAVLGERA